MSHYTEPKPLFQRLLHKCLMIRFEWELFVVHWLIVLEIESVFVGFAPSQVRFGYTDHFSVFSQQLEILFFELCGHVEIGAVSNVLI